MTLKLTFSEKGQFKITSGDEDHACQKFAKKGYK